MKFFYTKVPIIADKITQASCFWRPSGTNGTTFLVLPGLDESIVHYESFINELTFFLPDFSILAIDLRGQGMTLESEGAIKADLVSIDEQMTIIKQITDSLSIESLFVIGLSYGGAVALCCANRLKNVEGVALLAPYVSNFKSYSDGLSGLWYSLIEMNPFYKTISTFSLPIYFKLLHDAKVLNPYVYWTNDKLDALTKLTLGIEEIDTNKEAQKLPALKYGVHILIGEKDPLVSVKAVEHLYHELKCAKKTIQLVPDLGHRLLMNDHLICAKWVVNICNGPHE